MFTNSNFKMKFGPTILGSTEPTTLLEGQKTFEHNRRLKNNF